MPIAVQESQFLVTEVNEQADLWAGMVQTACSRTWEFRLGQAQDACWLHDLDSKYRS